MAGPARLANIKVEIDDRGRVVHTFRQSSLNDLDMCLERGRLTMTGEMPPQETDAANAGTAIHAGIEQALLELRDDGQVCHVDTAVHVALAEFEEMTQHPAFKWLKMNRVQAETFIESAVRLWYAEVLPRMRPVEIEWRFGPIVIYEDDERVIQITGTIDLIDEGFGLADWKSASDDRKYRRGRGGEAWKIERWAIQPTVYTAAGLAGGKLDPDLEEWPFTYFAFPRGSGAQASLQELRVTRHRGDLAWLVEKCLAATQLIEAGLTSWPKNDNHALCSETWCPAWNLCRGKHYAKGWPKPSKPAPIEVETQLEMPAMLPQGTVPDRGVG